MRNPVWTLLALSFVATSSVAAQTPVGLPGGVTPPPPAQAAALLQNAVANNPGLANTIQQRIAQSGLTPDQIRSRLQAAGYSPSLLDAYMGDSATVANAQLNPGSTETSAIQALGLPAIVATDTITTKTGIIVAPAPPPAAGLAVFGVDVFRRSTTQFYPLLSGPVPPDYKLGPGDQLVLILTGDVEQTYQLQITREGFVLIPQVGQLFLSNLTLDQARDVLYSRLGRVFSGVRRGAGATTRFDISVASVRAVQVYVVGEGAQPGAYQISALGTVLTGLYAAGGVTGLASGRQIEVRRDGKAIATFDLYDYLLKGDTKSDLRLEDGDVIFVPDKSRRVAVTGSVNRPAQYDLAPNETLADLVREAGGLTADAASTRISITRIVPPAERGEGGAQRVVVDVPLDKSSATAIPPVQMMDGDSVAVFAVTDAVHHYVDVLGSVYLPGRFGWHEGLRLSEVVKLSGGLRPATYAGRAHISRWNPADSTRYLVSVELPKDSAASWPADSALHDRDVVTIYGRPDMRDSIAVAITGAVNQPGAFPYRAGMTLRDLVLMARGLKAGADLDYAEIARLPADRKGGVLATTIRVPLDSTYLFDRDSLGRFIGPPGLSFKASGAPEVPIEPYDNVLIFHQPGFELQRSVTVLGRVRFPGTYALQRRDERLTELLERAGGLALDAYPDGVRFYRSVDAEGRVNLDLTNALKHPNSADNLVLQPNDTIVVPEYEAVVKVTGAVNSPGSVLWKDGASAAYYISAAGGYSYKADGRHTNVRQANGTVATRSGKFLFFGGGIETPDPGAIITVPFKDPNTPHTDPVALFGGIAQVLASVLTLVFVATKL